MHNCLSHQSEYKWIGFQLFITRHILVKKVNVYFPSVRFSRIIISYKLNIRNFKSRDFLFNYLTYCNGIEPGVQIFFKVFIYIFSFIPIRFRNFRYTQSYRMHAIIRLTEADTNKKWNGLAISKNKNCYLNIATRALLCFLTFRHLAVYVRKQESLFELLVHKLHFIIF